MARYKIGKFVPQGQELAQRVRSLELYVGRLSQELEYVLAHLDRHNFTPEEWKRMTELTNK